MRFIPLLRALVVLAAFPFAAARAQDKVVINADNAKMHEQPSMTAPGKPVTRGTALIVLERNGTWITVFDGRVQGFVHAALVVPVAPTTPQATPVPPAAPMYPPQATPMYPPQAAPMYPPQGTPAAQPYGTGAVGVGGKSGQVRFPGTPGYKDGTTARVLGLLIPGGEAFYTGQTSKGIFKAALGYGALIDSARGLGHLHGDGRPRGRDRWVCCRCRKPASDVRDVSDYSAGKARRHHAWAPRANARCAEALTCWTVETRRLLALRGGACNLAGRFSLTESR